MYVLNGVLSCAHKVPKNNNTTITTKLTAICTTATGLYCTMLIFGVLSSHILSFDSLLHAY